MLIETERFFRSLHFDEDDAVPDHVDETTAFVTRGGAFELATRIPHPSPCKRGYELVQECLSSALFRIARIKPLRSERLEIDADVFSGPGHPREHKENATPLPLKTTPESRLTTKPDRESVIRLCEQLCELLCEQSCGL